MAPPLKTYASLTFLCTLAAGRPVQPKAIFLQFNKVGLLVKQSFNVLKKANVKFIQRNQKLISWRSRQRLIHFIPVATCVESHCEQSHTTFFLVLRDHSIYPLKILFKALHRLFFPVEQSNKKLSADNVHCSLQVFLCNIFRCGAGQRPGHPVVFCMLRLCVLLQRHIS